MSSRIIIIGAGLAGMSAAALLAKQGFEVTIIEKTDQAGGRARVEHEQGFTLDMGPSWYMMPDVFERFFARFDRKPTDYYKLQRLDPSYRMFFPDGSSVDKPSSSNATSALFETIEPGSSVQLGRLLADAELKYKLAIKYLYRSYSRIGEFLNKEILWDGLRLGITRSYDSHLRRYFKSEKLIQMLEFMSLFLGASPMKLPSLYTLIAHADHNLGIWYPRGGFGQVAQGFYRLAQEQGVKFILNEAVTRIETKGGMATTVHTCKGAYSCDEVIVNADYAYAEQQLLAPKDRSYSKRYWQRKVLAPSSLLIFLGIKKKIKNLEHHNIVVADWDTHMRATMDPSLDLPENPSFYISVPSKSDVGIAPPDCENIMVLIPLASGKTDAHLLHEKYYNYVLARVEEISGQRIADDIVVKRIESNGFFGEMFNAYHGNAFGLGHTLLQTAIFRPRNRSRKVKNLYYAGHFTNPGTGTPLAVVSGEVVASLINEKY